jgi:hypothetical protein
MIYDEFIGKQLLDVGTRYLHMVQLLEMWENGLVVLSGHPTLSTANVLLKPQLEAGVELLRTHIDTMANVKDFLRYQYATLSVNPDPTKILGGRGTELVDWKYHG